MAVNVKSATVTATGTVVAIPARIVNIFMTGNALASTLVLRDGGASGTTMGTWQTLAAEGMDIDVPGDGMRFATDVHATLTNGTRLTILYI